MAETDTGPRVSLVESSFTVAVWPSADLDSLGRATSRSTTTEQGLLRSGQVRNEEREEYSAAHDRLLLSPGYRVLQGGLRGRRRLRACPNCHVSVLDTASRVALRV